MFNYNNIFEMFIANCFIYVLNKMGGVKYLLNIIEIRRSGDTYSIKSLKL
jgi:hypothetical protein